MLTIAEVNAVLNEIAEETKLQRVEFMYEEVYNHIIAKNNTSNSYEDFSPFDTYNS